MEKINYDSFSYVDFDIQFNEKFQVVSSAKIGKFEINAIGRYMTYAIARTEKQIQRWIDHPQNEGQATYSARIRDLEKEIKIYKDFLKAYKHNNTTKK
jgi:hypothetical protein